MGLFNIFKKQSKKLDKPIDLALLNCDIHSHLIPNIDDGSKSLEDSIAMIKDLAGLGYKKLVTTPHIMGDYYRNTKETIFGGLENVKSALLQENISVELSAAAEYYIDSDFEAKLESGKLLSFGKNYLLFEVSYVNPPENLDHVIFKMQTYGYKPVLAHPERYNFWHNQFSKYQNFVEKGVLLQLNLNSLTGYYSPATKHIAEQLIKANLISFAGTDCHHSGHINLLQKAVYEKSLLDLIESGKLLNSSL